MKLSVSLPEEDVALLDDHARKSGLRSRSAALRQAIRLLPRSDLEEAYAQAWEDWNSSGERDGWEGVAGDGDSGRSWVSSRRRRSPQSTMRYGSTSTSRGP